MIAADRVLLRAELIEQFGRPRDYRLVFTNGVFDLLHAGHLQSLERARALGDRLVVAVNSDSSVRRLKGRDRPYQPAADRTLLLAGLRVVDAVTEFDEDTPAELLAELLPDVLVKGADYEGRVVAGADSVRAAGGEVRFIELVPGRSTTGLVDRIRER
ncbi:MAG: D-glycero-beta-D-manno-heptose 1-phosphate adenylyltransferase [Gemmatimonadales bacterium]|nr:MAG: D-glycero-beta-D-manno-heptose 1-phosphate adenylyltransferase [Gemmatimonadales bacterium]